MYSIITINIVVNDDLINIIRIKLYKIVQPFLKSFIFNVNILKTVYCVNNS